MTAQAQAAAAGWARSGLDRWHLTATTRGPCRASLEPSQLQACVVLQVSVRDCERPLRGLNETFIYLIGQFLQIMLHETALKIRADSSLLPDSLVYEGERSFGSSDRLARVDAAVLRALYGRLEPGADADAIVAAMAGAGRRGGD